MPALYSPKTGRWNFVVMILWLTVLNMDLDGPRATICRGFKSLVCFLELIPVRYQGLQIDDFVLQKSNCRRPRVVITVDELQINLYSRWLVQHTIRMISFELTSASDMCINGSSFIIGLPTPITMSSPAGRGR